MATARCKGHAEVIVNGKFAQFGGRMMTSVSDMILAAIRRGLFAKGAGAAGRGHGAGRPSAAAPAAARLPRRPSAPPVVAKEFNALALLWALITQFLCRPVWPQGLSRCTMPRRHDQPTPDGLRERLFKAGYIADEDLASLIWMGLTLERPLLLEGAAGVGKTAIAGACARALGRPLLRLQCYEGLDLSQAVYEWNYSRQLLEIRLAEARPGRPRGAARQPFFRSLFAGAPPAAGDPLAPALRPADRRD